MAGDDIFFSDAKMFVLQQQFNVQNDRVWSILLRSSRKINHSVIPKCVKSHGLSMVNINGEYYKTDVLEKYLLPATWILYGEEYFCFQQGRAPPHTHIQQWCDENLPDFITKWLLSSPDLIPLDFSI
jgi:hypothetical protein